MPRSTRVSPSGVQLLQEKQLAVLATLMPDGSPQATPVWVDIEPDGSHLLINAVEGHLKTRNVARDPRVAVTVIDAQQPFRSVVVRGIVVETRGHEQGAKDHSDALARKYLGRDQYPLRPGERRVLLRIKPTHVLEGNPEAGARWRPS